MRGIRVVYDATPIASAPWAVGALRCNARFWICRTGDLIARPYEFSCG